jgi:hypothetical protein
MRRIGLPLQLNFAKSFAEHPLKKSGNASKEELRLAVEIAATAIAVWRHRQGAKSEHGIG